MSVPPFDPEYDGLAIVPEVSTSHVELDKPLGPNTFNARGVAVPNGAVYCRPAIKSNHSVLQVPSNGDKRGANKRVSFGRVHLYHFDRLQGFTCVPSQGGSTLGMADEHWAKEDVPVAEHQRRRKHQRYSALLKFCLEGKLLLSLQQFRLLEASVKQQQPSETTSTVECSTDRNGLKRSSEEPTGSGDDDLSFLDNLEEYYFLQPLTVKKRRLILRKSGLQRIDATEKQECAGIRASRAECGCTCPGGLCDPATCECAANDIPCQVDRVAFPCACVAPSTCVNPAGRSEFNLARVRTHYFHTRLRLNAEKKKAAVTPTNFDCDSGPKRARLLTESDGGGKEEESGAAGGVCDGFTNPAATSSLAAAFSDSSEAAALASTTSSGGCKDCQNDGYVHILMQDFQFLQQSQHQYQQPQDQTSLSSDVTAQTSPCEDTRGVGDSSGFITMPTQNTQDEGAAQRIVGDASADEEEQDDDEEEDEEEDSEVDEEGANFGGETATMSQSHQLHCCPLEPIASLFHTNTSDSTSPPSSSSSNVLGSSLEEGEGDEETLGAVSDSHHRPPSVCEVSRA